jgi:hypothetical protein
VSLVGPVKPHLLVTVRNNLGAETHVRYASSTKFYLADREAGRRWVTRLPFPVHVVEQVETLDGYAGSARLICKSEWDYKLILKFENSAGLKGFMNDKHGTVTEQWMPNIKALAVDGKVHEQNFVYDDIE